MHVTLDVFSGRPNPTWRLTSAEARQLIDRVAGQPVRPVTAHPTLLGFRGFLVNAELDEAAWRAGLPPQFAVARPPAPAGASAEAAAPTGRRRRAAIPAAEAAPAVEDVRPAAEADAADLLLQTAERAVDPNVLEAARRSVSAAGATAEAAVAAVEEAPVPGPVLEGAACEPFLTPVHPAFWDFPPILLNNNCYNYATNFASNTIAQPGRRTGQIYRAFECEEILRAARADGCLTSCEGTVRVVAMAVWPGFDFHWWRMHPGGTWAHKLGLTRVTNLDNLGRLLANGLVPGTCDRGPYTTFCGYYYAPLSMWVL